MSALHGLSLRALVIGPAELFTLSIVDDSSLIEARKVRQRMRGELTAGHDVHYAPASHRQMVGDDAPVASPP